MPPSHTRIDHGLNWAAQIALLLSGLGALATSEVGWKPDPAIGQLGDLCPLEVDGVLAAIPCPPDDDLWFASAASRRAVGAPACWWTAEQSDLSEISGVGEVLARRLVAHRDAGGPRSEASLLAVRGVGPALAGRIAAGTTEACSAARTSGLVTSNESGSGYGGPNEPSTGARHRSTTRGSELRSQTSPSASTVH